VGLVSQYLLECTGEQPRCLLVPYEPKYSPVHKLLKIVVRYLISSEIIARRHSNLCTFQNRPQAVQLLNINVDDNVGTSAVSVIRFTDDNFTDTVRVGTDRFPRMKRDGWFATVSERKRQLSLNELTSRLWALESHREYIMYLQLLF